MSKFILSVLTVVLAAGLLYVSILNVDPVSFTFSPLHAPHETALAVLLVATFITGFLFGIVITWLLGVRARTKKKKTQKTALSDIDAKIEAERAKQSTDLISKS